MAKQTAPTVGDLEKQRANLQAQAHDLQARREQLRAIQENINAQDVQTAIHELREATGELDAINKLLPEIDKAIRRLNAEIEQRRSADLEKQIAADRERERAALREVGKAAQGLNARLKELELVENAIESAGAWPQAWPGSLAGALHGTLEYWQKNAPEVLGLSPLPPLVERMRQERRREAESRVEFCEEQVKIYERLQSTLKGSAVHDAERWLEQAYVELKRAQEDLERA